jgi:hypothetical protein
MQNQLPFNINPDAHAGKGLQIWGLKGVKVHGAPLDHAIPAEELVRKVHAHLRDDKMTRNSQRPQQVISRIIPGLAEWDLGAGEDDGFAQALQHETKGTARVRKRVSAVHDHKPVIVIVVSRE